MVDYSFILILFYSIYLCYILRLSITQAHTNTHAHTHTHTHALTRTHTHTNTHKHTHTHTTLLDDKTMSYRPESTHGSRFVISHWSAMKWKCVFHMRKTKNYKGAKGQKNNFFGKDRNSRNKTPFTKATPELSPLLWRRWVRFTFKAFSTCFCSLCGYVGTILSLGWLNGTIKATLN